ncbi:MAG: hypothetical protein AB9891_17465 [Anaerolineaceae bacterium]
MNNQEIPFLPFAAINNFMLPDYRSQVLSKVIGGLSRQTNRNAGILKSLIRRYIQVPGFRDASKAPAALIARNADKTFEQTGDFAGRLIACWVDLNPILAAEVHALLAERQWPDLLPLDADRMELPGFYASWPEKETFETILAAYKEKYPDSKTEDYDISLMTVWLGGRLPFDDGSEEEK